MNALYTALFGAACFTLGARSAVAWRRAGERLNAVQDEYKHPAAGTPDPPQVAAIPPPAPLPGPALERAVPDVPPAPGQDDLHGGTVTTVTIKRCGWMRITDHDKGEAEEFRGECAECDKDKCHLCGFYQVFDPFRSRWVQRWQRCPAHAEQVQP